MQIYICDDTSYDLLRLRRFLEKYAQEEHLLFEIMEFYSAGKLLEAYEAAQKKPALIFLDIFMEEMDGMEAAKILREKSEAKDRIVFTTASKEHALDAFRIHADGYLHKPFVYQEFKNTMERVREYLKEPDRMIEIRVERLLRKIRIKDILYIETDNHGIRLHVGDDDYRSSISMTQVATMLKDEPVFMFCGKSYLVNLEYVEKVEDGMIVVKDGSRIIIPIRLRTQIREMYQSYLDGRKKYS